MRVHHLPETRYSLKSIFSDGHKIQVSSCNHCDRSPCNNWPSFCVGLYMRVSTDAWLFCQTAILAKNRTAPPLECVGGDISFTTLASKPDTLSANNALSSWSFMAWNPAEWAVNSCTIFYSINSCYTCSEREHSRSILSRRKKQPLSKSCPRHLYKHTEPCRLSCIFQTSASSSQPASLTSSGPVNATIISLIPQVQVHRFDSLFSTHLLYAGGVIYQ